MKILYFYFALFILILSSCDNKKDEFINNLESTIEFISQNQDSLTSEILEVYNEDVDSEIIGLKENQFSIYKSEMSNEEIEKVNLLFGKYNDLRNNIQVEEFINELESIVEFVSQNIDSLTITMDGVLSDNRTIESYNSQINSLKENKFLIFRSKMTNEEIEKVNLLFGRYDALKIRIHMKQIKNKFTDGLVQGANLLNELFSK